MKIDKTFCDNCNGELVNCECAENQIRFILQECMDGGEKYEFCGAECLKNFVINKEFENRFYRWRTIINKRKAKKIQEKK